MNNKHQSILKEIIDDETFAHVAGGAGGSGDWGTGAGMVWGTVVGAISGKSCSLPGNFYDSSTLGNSGVCVAYPEPDWEWIKRMTQGSTGGR